jgi:phenylalanine-4-hydroxylase
VSSPAVELPADHPGASDPEYRARRDAIAEVGAAYRPGDPIPDVEYAPEEDALWALVSRELAAKHERYAVAEYMEAAARLDLPRQRVPQLREVSARLEALSGFRMRPVPGLVPTRQFYGSLADRTFCSTQYVRHHSVPLYTPEPDVVHELVGHANMLASPTFADLYQLAGEASRRAETEAALEFFSRVFWFSFEFGVAWEGSELRTYGAGLLSSFGELDAFRRAEVREFDIVAMGTTAYDITVYQPLLFAGRSMAQVVDELGAFLSTYDDERYLELVN